MIDADDTDESDMFSFGKVVGVDGDGITIRKYDFDRDADVESVYPCHRDAEFGNVGSLAELRAGDNVLLVKEDDGDEAEGDEYFN